MSTDEKIRVVSREKTIIVCATCQGWGYKRALYKGSVLMKNHPCKMCKGKGRVVKTITTKLTPIDVKGEFGKSHW